MATDDQAADEPGIDDDAPGSDVGSHHVLDLWGELVAAAEKLAVAARWSMSGPQKLAAVAAGERALAMVESAWLGQVRDLDSCPDAVAGARPGQVARTFLVQGLRRGLGQAGSDVRAARALEPDLPAVAGGMPCTTTAIAAGDVSRRHVDVIGRVMRRLPSPAARAVETDDAGRTGAERVEEFLAEQARTLDPDALARLGRQVLARLDPDQDEAGYDADAYRRRYLSLIVAPDGMTLLRGALPAAQAAVVRTALEALAAPQAASKQPDEDGQPVLITDDRSRNQRLVDALTALATRFTRTSAADGAEAAPGAGRAHVTIITDLDQLAAARAALEPEAAARASGAVGLAHCPGHGPLSAAALGLLSCDARLRAVVLDRNGAVLHLGRSQRLATTAQRIALAARDRGCVIPGCGAPAEWCDAHHVTWWSNGGPTDIDAMALVCPRHHTDLHHGVWQLRIRDGIPWARPPVWAALRLEREHWVRNTVHHAMDTARQLGRQLRLDLDAA